MDPDRLDLSALDPSRDEERWETLVRAVVASRSAAATPATQVLFQLVSSWRPVLALAAAAVALAWAPAILTARERSAPPAAIADPVLSTTTWMLREQAPATAEVVAAMGARNAAR